MTHEFMRHPAGQAEHELRVLQPQLANILAKHGFRRGVQVVVGDGANAKALLDGCSLERLYRVDSYRRDSATARLDRFGERFVMINEASDIAANRVPEGMDFVFLDGELSDDEVTSHLRTWVGKVREGGVIAGRMRGQDGSPAGKKAAEAFFGRFRWTIHAEGSGLWWTMKQPVPISFFIPAFNCSQTLAEAVSSITLTNISADDEVIIVDDGSTDSTATCAKQIAAEDGRVRVIQHRRNKGGASARNTAVEAARHSVLFCLDSDNVLEQNSISGLRKCIVDHGADVAAFQELHFFRENPGQTTHVWRFKPGIVELQDYLAGTIVPGASGNYMFTAQSWAQAGGYPIDAKALDTWGFGLRQVATGARMITQPATRYFHRYGHESYWTREVRAARTALIALMLLIPYLERLDKRDVEYLFSKRGRGQWFESLDRRPLHVRGTPTGVAGSSLVTGHPEEADRAISEKQRWH